MMCGFIFNDAKINPTFGFARILFFSLSLFMMCLVIAPDRANAADSMPVYRGFNVDANKVSKQDIDYLARTGANIARLSFHNLPMMDKAPPYAINPAAMEKFDRILDWCEAVKVRVIVDPHTFPGMKNIYATRMDDPLWSDFAYHARIVTFWNELSRRYKDRGQVIFAYDILNEPNIPAMWRDGESSDWNLLAAKIVSAIRVYDKSRYVVIEPKIGKLMPSSTNLFRKQWAHCMDTLDDLVLPKDFRLIVSPHVYLPLKFTHQGVVPGFVSGYSYPAMIDGVDWNKDSLRKSLEPVIRFQKRYNVPILVGEFSAVRSTGDAGNRYLRDLIDIFEENGWGWAYHSFRAAGVWDAEMSNYDAKDQNRYQETPRMKMLKGYLSKNKSAPL